MAKAPVKRRPGRPTKYSPELGAEFCARLIEAQHGYREVVAADDMPAGSTFFAWLHKHDEFKTMYDAALELRAIAMHEDMLAIADTPMIGTTTTTEGDKTKVVTGDMTDHRKLQVETRKWSIARMGRSRFGDKVALEHSGKIETPATPVLNVTIGRIEPEPSP